MVNYLILLPPSEGKITGEEKQGLRLSFEELTGARLNTYLTMCDFLNRSKLEDVSKVLELKGDKLAVAINANVKRLNQPTLPVIERYSGVMFKAIDYSSMKLLEKSNFNSGVLFIDGMFGLLKPEDLIPDYKMKITTKFNDFNATKFWKENLSDLWRSLFNDKIVIDILPQAHRNVVDFSKAKETYQITFGEIINGKFKQAGHNSKKLKGELVRYLVSKDNLTKKDLENFKHSDGYSYSKELSDEKKIVYLKS